MGIVARPWVRVVEGSVEDGAVAVAVSVRVERVRERLVERKGDR